jgi:hypothetical protein
MTDDQHLIVHAISIHSTARADTVLGYICRPITEQKVLVRITDYNRLAVGIVPPETTLDQLADVDFDEADEEEERTEEPEHEGPSWFPRASSAPLDVQDKPANKAKPKEFIFQHNCTIASVRLHRDPETHPHLTDRELKHAWYGLHRTGDALVQQHEETMLHVCSWWRARTHASLTETPSILHLLHKLTAPPTVRVSPFVGGMNKERYDPCRESAHFLIGPWQLLGQGGGLVVRANLCASHLWRRLPQLAAHVPEYTEAASGSVVVAKRGGGGSGVRGRDGDGAHQPAPVDGEQVHITVM